MFGGDLYALRFRKVFVLGINELIRLSDLCLKEN